MQSVNSLRSLSPSSVSIIATLDGDGQPHGFTAGSFTWLSSTPPLVTFCLSQSATSYPVFAGAQGFSVNVLRLEHQELATRFATKGVDKFAGGEFLLDAGYPVLTDAVMTLQCHVRDRMFGGGHLFIVGEVVDADGADGGRPLVMYRGSYQTLRVGSS